MGPARILAAMLIGVVAAGLTSLKKAGGLSSAFFEGAGYGYTHVISLIVAASTFAEGIRVSGLIADPDAGPGSLAGGRDGRCDRGAVGPGLRRGHGHRAGDRDHGVLRARPPGSMGIDPVRLGTLTAMGAHFGRTMSPAAAVVMMSPGLPTHRAADLIRRVASRS